MYRYILFDIVILFLKFKDLVRSRILEWGFNSAPIFGNWEPTS